MIRLGEVSRAQLRVFARYSTEFPCLLKGIVNAGELQAEAFRGFTLHIVLETLPNQPRRLRPAGPARARARTAARRASTCPTRPDPRPTRSGDSPTSRTASTSRPARAPSARAPATPELDTSLFGIPGYAGSTAEADLLRDLLAPGPRRRPRPTCPTSVRCWSGPLARGATVSLGEPIGGGVMRIKLLDKKTGVDLVKLLVFIVVTTLATGVLVATIGNLSLSAQEDLQGRVRRRDRRGQGRRHPDRRRQGRHRPGRRDQGPHPGAGDLRASRRRPR